MRRSGSTLAAYYTNPYQRKLAALSRLPEKPQIILMGSSRAKYGLSPREFRRFTYRRAFNLGVPASKPLEWRLFAERAFADYAPELVVLGVNASAIRADYLPVPAAVDLFDWNDFLTYCRTDGWASEVAEPFLARQIGRAWVFYGRRYGLKSVIQEQLGVVLPKHAQASIERRAMVARPCPDDGFEHPWLSGRNLRTLGQRLESADDAVKAAEVPPFSPDAAAIAHFESLLKWFNERNIRLVVAYLPNSPRTERRWQSVEPQMIETIEDACRRRNVPFIPHADPLLCRSDNDYIEEIHAGLPLARRISERIAQHLIASELLPDGRPIFAQLPEEGAAAP